MRNFLTVLTLCVFTLMTSDVFADVYDDSKRTERFGLSFYDGAPMYVFRFERPHPQPSGWNGRDGVVLTVTRLYTGDNLADYGSVGPDGSVRYVVGNQYNLFTYGYDDNGDLVILDASGALGSISWLNRTLRSQGRGALAMAHLGGGDLAVETYDNILPNAQDWARRGILLAVALLVISTGLNKFRELTSGGSTVSSNGEDKAGSDALAYDKLSRSDRKLFDAAVSGTLATGLSERLLSKDLRDAADFISGRAFGLEFDAKVQNSNRILLESFWRLSKEDQDALLEEYRNMSWGASYEESIEKRFLALRGENFADEANPFNLNRESYGGRSGRYYVARGGVLEGFNSFEGEDDEEDGEPPF